MGSRIGGWANRRVGGEESAVDTELSRLGRKKGLLQRRELRIL